MPGDPTIENFAARGQMGELGQESGVDPLTGVIVGVIWSLVFAILFLYPLWRTLSRAGFRPAWSLPILIPFLSFATIPAILGMLAFRQWPSLAGPAERTSWKALSRTAWTPVSSEEAAKNQYYGLGGWILAFYGGIAAGIVMNLINVFNSHWSEIIEDIYGLTRGETMILVGLSVVFGIVFLILIPMKHRLVPKLVIACIWLGSLLSFGVILVLHTVTPIFFVTIVGGTLVINALLLTGYWLKSKRVNVTYLHRIPAA